MTITISIGWWFAPAAVTAISLFCVYWFAPKAEPSDFSPDFGEAFVVLALLLSAVSASLLSWLVWAVLR